MEVGRWRCEASFILFPRKFSFFVVALLWNPFWDDTDHFLSRFTPSLLFRSCADYVKHLMKTMKEKEHAVDQLKTDLEVKESKVEEDKALQESRSDPESVTSSLTASTSRAKHGEASSGNTKRKALFTGESDTANPSKKHRKASCDSATSEDSSSGEERASRGDSSDQSSSIDETKSSVSDITDSNRGSSSNNSGSGSEPDHLAGRHSTHASAATDEDEEQSDKQSSISNSSDAAVARENDSGDRHGDVVFNNGKNSDWIRKRPPEEISSLERSFELCYAEVFGKCHIPQLIAATSGKVVTCKYHEFGC
jgi:hypothetical protein